MVLKIDVKFAPGPSDPIKLKVLSMLTRRHIRAKVMQSIYALIISKEESLDKQRSFLRYSMDSMYVLYLVILELLLAVHKMAGERVALSEKRYLKDTAKEYPNKSKFVQNRLLSRLATNEMLQDEVGKRKLKNWYLHPEYVKLVYTEVTESRYYQEYMRSGKDSFEEDRNLVANLFRNCIAPVQKVNDYYEDEQLTWADDLPFVNTFLLKRIKQARPNFDDAYFLPRLLKDDDDQKFADQLLTKTLLQNKTLEEAIEGKTPNWDKERIAEVDGILLKMAICELLNFPSIPEKVTLNEYLEIAKEYSTPKSSLFLNGVLDKLVREYKAAGKLHKTGRGLL